MDQIHIRGLRLRTLIGFHEWERDREQDVIVDLTIFHDQRQAAKSDDVEHSVDYARLRDEVCAYAADNQHGLLETLAQRLAELVLANHNVRGVRLRVDKPGALRFSDSVGVEIYREQDGDD